MYIIYNINRQSIRIYTTCVCVYKEYIKIINQYTLTHSDKICTYICTHTCTYILYICIATGHTLLQSALGATMIAASQLV